ncbi:homoprotocatechuate degradation operon regulator HpaR [Trinickia fusca]|uniref:Homoprotocatechuate degradation operon regulator HpaR n=1 Tax=Trinickia fusca TaxID=2419777 RepID=A0A494XU85_9BURK|nr:homoprotocatechuate degradation operon regulator HpaR [Trinickia fusca]RKP52526.1 homoprotocatechuate degradation operon regulator HpaR [Trinickia fusca]
MNRPFEHRNLAMLLLQARESLMGLFRPILKEFSLTEQQWRIIRTLGDAPRHELEAGQIAKQCCILSPSLTGVLERMERDGLIRRMRPLADQRKLIVSLTAKSLDLVAVIRPRIDAQYKQLEASLGPSVLGDLYSRLDRLIDAVPPAEDEVPAQQDAPPAKTSRRTRAKMSTSTEQEGY